MLPRVCLVLYESVIVHLFCLAVCCCGTCLRVLCLNASTPLRCFLCLFSRQWRSSRRSRTAQWATSQAGASAATKPTVWCESAPPRTATSPETRTSRTHAPMAVPLVRFAFLTRCSGACMQSRGGCQLHRFGVVSPHAVCRYVVPWFPVCPLHPAHPLVLLCCAVERSGYIANARIHLRGERVSLYCVVLRSSLTAISCTTDPRMVPVAPTTASLDWLLDSPLMTIVFVSQISTWACEATTPTPAPSGPSAPSAFIASWARLTNLCA